MKSLIVICILLFSTSFIFAGNWGDPGFEVLKSAEKAHVKRNYYEAEKLYLKAINSGDLDKYQLSGAYHNLGAIYQDNFKNSEKAILQFSNAIKTNPAFPEAYYSRGNYYLKNKKFKQAIHDFTKAIELKPKYFQAYFNRGNCWDDLGEYDKAYDDFAQAIKYRGGNYPKAEHNRKLVNRKRQKSGSIKIENKDEPYAGMSLKFLRKNYSITMDQKGINTNDRIMIAEYNGYVFEIVGDDTTGKIKRIHNKYKVEDAERVKENYKMLLERAKNSKIIHVE